jgi:glycosyltransferase involved in cell wall biosynthesis
MHLNKRSTAEGREVLKKNICIIGPLPPPINGNSKAIDTIIKSEQCNDIFNINIVNLAGSTVGMSGKFTLKKLKTLIRALKDLKNIQQRNIINTYYITIAQSTLGCLRDVALLHQIYKRKNNAKVVLHLHGGGFGDFYHNANPILKRLIKNYYSKANTLIVLSESLRSMFSGIFDDNNIRIVENCVDNDYVLPDSVLKNKWDNIQNRKCIQLVYLSNMIKSKGYFDVLQSAKILLQKKLHCKFTFAGTFVNKEQKDEFLKYIKDNGLDSCVEYLGVVSGEDKKNLLMKGDLFILPTYYPHEGQPISIIEAMASGMAIITTPHGGIPDVIKEGENGYFVQAQDIQNISDKIAELVKQPEKIIEIGRNNREKVMEKYLEAQYIKNMIDAFND